MAANNFRQFSGYGISERIAQLDSSRTEAAEGRVWSSVKFRLVEERIEDISIAVTTHAACIPGKDRMVEDVKEVHTDFKLVAFPRRKWYPKGFGQACVKSVQGRCAQCVSANDASANRWINNKA